MMMPNAMTTTRDGGSLFQRNVVGQQAGSFMAAQGVPTGNQAVNGLQDAVRQALQADRTDYHGRVQEGLNFPGGPPEDAARNALMERKRAANQLLLTYKGGIGAAGAVDYTNLIELGRRLTQGMG